MANKLISKICKASIAALTALTFLTTSPIIADEKHPKKEWKVSAYLDGDSEGLDIITYHNLNQLEQVGSNETIDIYAQLDMLETFGTKRFHITKDEDMKKIGSKEEPGFNQELNMGTYKNFKDFINWIEQSESNRGMLIIKGHGLGIMMPLEQIAYDIYETNETVDKYLPTYTIDKAFEESLKKPLEILIFDSCEKATIEVAYQLKEHARIIVASEDLLRYRFSYSYGSIEVLLAGPPYEKILGNITQNPNTDAKELSKFIIDSYFKIFENNKDIKKIQTTLSAINLENIESFVEKFSKFSNILIKNMKDKRTRHETVILLQKSLTESQSYIPPDSLNLYTHVDLFDFLEKVYNNSKNEEIKNVVEPLNQSEIIIWSRHKGDDVKNSKGISIMFIGDYEIIDKYHGLISGRKTSDRIKKYYSRSEFAQKTGWDKVQELYSKYSK
ncbi:MAG: clostripain-related cysteine peptidase [Nanoarchaeota archaeon]|nr:clostripain-related cysteine peptidase [Nanoarchaeota archaeon]